MTHHNYDGERLKCLFKRLGSDEIFDLMTTECVEGMTVISLALDDHMARLLSWLPAAIRLKLIEAHESLGSWRLTGSRHLPGIMAQINDDEIDELARRKQFKLERLSPARERGGNRPGRFSTASLFTPGKDSDAETESTNDSDCSPK